MPTYDMRCVACGSVKNVFLTVTELGALNKNISDGDPVYKIDCDSCDGMFATQNFTVARNFIHGTHSGMYGKYHPGLGCVVHDRAHKNRLLREQGVVEAADPIGGSRTVLGDSSIIEQHFDSPGSREREAKEKEKRARDVLWI